MAESPSHRLGQIIGELVEDAIHPLLEEVARRHGLYLDAKHPRKARGGKSKVAWTDANGNTHDLDYVLELGGTEGQIGSPKAFVEIAWRRYTKHTRNKAQEIQGAIIPLAERYADARPFLGVVLAGVFTEASLSQLRSLGFKVVYFPYDSVLAAFAAEGFDVAFDEHTTDSQVARKVRQCRKLTAGQRAGIAKFLRNRHRDDLDTFASALNSSLTRTIQYVYVLPLHGSRRNLGDVARAIAFIESFDETSTGAPFVRYEVGVRYCNGDEIRGHFEDKAAAVAFLHGMQ